MMDNNKCFLCQSDNKDIKVYNCKDCRNSICNECVLKNKYISFVIKEHQFCIECEEEITCYKSICSKCDIHPYHMITNNIGVGSCDSNYKDFDVIIDLNYPENNVKEGEIDFYKKDKKIIIKIGLIDREIKENESYKYIREIIPVIYKYYSDKNILFHCYAGMSRSAFFAVAYLSYSEKITIKEAYDLVKSKRKFIKINKGFMNALEKFENSNKE